MKEIQKQIASKKEELESMKSIISMITPNYSHSESIKVYEEHLRKAFNIKKEIISLEKQLKNG